MAGQGLYNQPTCLLIFGRDAMPRDDIFEGLSGLLALENA